MKNESLQFAKSLSRFLGVPLRRRTSIYSMQLPVAWENRLGVKTLRFTIDPEIGRTGRAPLLAPGSPMLHSIADQLRELPAVCYFRLQATAPTGPADCRRRLRELVQVSGGKIIRMRSSLKTRVRLAVDFRVSYRSDRLEQEIVRLVELPNRSFEEVASNAACPFRGAEPSDRNAPIRKLKERYRAACDAARLIVAAKAEARLEETWARLAESLARIRTYFREERIEKTLDAPREEEERLKIGEEIELHRLRVEIRPLTIAVLAVPSREFNLLLQSGNLQASLVLDHDLSTDSLLSPFDATPLEVPLRLAICREGHATPDDLRCGACANSICQDHAVTCSDCEQLTCRACAVDCEDCKRSGCPDHSAAPCVTCARRSCGRCGGDCVVCSGRTCPRHRVACDSCQEPTCPEHRVVCSCGKTACRDDVIKDPISGIAYCRSCATYCPVCNQAMSKATSNLCTRCGVRICRSDIVTCSICNLVYCPDHVRRCTGCGSTVCRDHFAGPGQVTCPRCY